MIPEPASHSIVPYKSQTNIVPEKIKVIVDIKQFLIDDSFEFQVADYRNFYKAMSGHVIVLLGGSTAGKTTIIQSLKELDKSLKEEGGDLTSVNIVYEYMEKYHKKFGVSDEDWKHLHSVLIPRKNNFHIHDAVGIEITEKEHGLVFKPWATTVDRERAFQTAKRLYKPVNDFVKDTRPIMDHMVMDKVLERAKKGESVTFDLLDINGVKDHLLNQQTNIKSVLVYCPLNKLVERIAERNKKALSGQIDASEVRPGTFPLIQYAWLVRPKDVNDHPQQVIDKVTKQEVESLFDKTFDAGIETRKQLAEGRIELENMQKKPGGIEAIRNRDKKELLEAFGFKPEDPPNKSIELVPRKNYDLYVDTSNPHLGSTPAERAHTVANAILKF